MTIDRDKFLSALLAVSLGGAAAAGGALVDPPRGGPTPFQRVAGDGDRGLGAGAEEGERQLDHLLRRTDPGIGAEGAAGDAAHGVPLLRHDHPGALRWDRGAPLGRRGDHDPVDRVAPLGEEVVQGGPEPVVVCIHASILPRPREGWVTGPLVSCGSGERVR